MDKEELSEWDKIERGVIDPNKRTHKEKFNGHMNDVLDSFPTELMMGNLSEAIVTEKEFEQIGKDVSYVLHKVQKNTEGQKRGVTCSKEKAKRRSTIVCWKARLLNSKGLPHNKKAMGNREQHVETNPIE